MHPIDIAQDDVVQIGIDEYQLLGWTLYRDGRIQSFRIDSGETRFDEQVFEADQVVSSSFLVSDDIAAFGLVDGTVQLARIGFETKILDAEDLDAATLEALRSVAVTNYGRGVIEPTPGGQYRSQELLVERTVASKVASGPIVRMVHTMTSGGPLVMALVDNSVPAPAVVVDPDAEPGAIEADGAMEAADVADPDAETDDVAVADDAVADADRPRFELLALGWNESTNFLTGEVSISLREPVRLPFDEDTPPDFLRVNNAGTETYLVWKDGRMVQLATRDLAATTVSERGSLLPPGRGETLTFFEPILGGNTYMWGTSSGRLEAGFPVRAAEADLDAYGLYDAQRPDDAVFAFARTKSLADADSAPISKGSSARSRMSFAGFDNGEIRLYNITNASEVMRTKLPEAAAVLAVVMSPKEDGLLAATPSGLYHANLDPRFPEAGFSAFFRPVWYEGYAEPDSIWQSSSGTDDFEMKLGLMPLVFGTLKATFYSMLFGAPLALLAALFTSEFLHGRVKGYLKPSIELMASLPSVVLGFLAALVFAPYVETVVPATLGLMLTLPVTLLLGAYLWQLLPPDKSIVWAPWRFAVMVVLIPVGVLFAGLIGPIAEGWLFGGDIKGWLSWAPGAGLDDERFATATGGWMLLFVPLSALVVAIGSDRFVNPRMRDMSARLDRQQFAALDLAKFVGALVATIILAYGLSVIVSALGFDPRGSFVDTYVQRNALIVGFAMGFAIIPIIYTISEDALSTVPEHLRSASLGAGATTWQTATRVVIPVAMSGLFSALMVGLGRAVGETMIVLMAAGNTPIMEWNVFAGFRTLSANIAVELPEAVRGDTHYRTLFLAALVLFLMTFVVNTIAEVIRQRFRKRAYQL
ncbi:MAG: ABC transporter permease subunit [Acidobacteriota bacterium]